MAALWVQALPPEPDQNKRFRGNPGLREMPNKDSPPIMYFYLLFTVQYIFHNYLMKNIQVTIDIGPIGPLAVKGGNKSAQSARWQLKNTYSCGKRSPLYPIWAAFFV
jgi:hypothetical protein